MSTELNIDIKENEILKIDADLLEILLKDKTTGKNILWATDNYRKYGEKYNADQQIKIDLITGDNGSIIRPRVAKSNSSGYVKKPKSLRQAGFAIYRTIWLMKSGLTARVFLI